MKNGHTTLTLQLPPELDAKLKATAGLHGISPEEHALQILDQNLTLTPQQRAEALRRLFDSFREEDDDGDVSWDEVLMRMDETRPDGQKLFPPELKGITW
jgi:plasmid stability protein